MKTIATMLRSVLPFGGAERSKSVRCRVLFVCMGNVCRSPTAEAVFRHQLDAAGLSGEVECASAGTHDFNVGRAPDGRARAAAARRGYRFSRARGRQVADADFSRYDLILAMDRQNLESLTARCPPELRERIRLLMEFARRHTVEEVPDPYFGNAKGFDLVLDMIEDACVSLIEHVRGNYLSAQQIAVPPAE